MKIKIIFLNFLVLIVFLILIELITRLLIFFYKGYSTAGIEGRSNNLIYQPYIMFGVDNDIKLKNYENDIENHINVLLLGGSTTEFFPDELIEEKLGNYFGKKINLYNSAFRGYNARQELVFLSIWGSKINPDLIISMDGANDIVHSLRVKRTGTFFTNQTYEILLTKPYLGPFIYLLQQSQFYNSIFRVLARYKKFNEEDYHDHMDIYIDAQKQISTISQSLNAVHISILQPYLGFKDPKNQFEENFDQYDFRDLIIKQLYNYTYRNLNDLHSQTNTFFLDARFIFNEIDERIFIDDVHFYGNKGYDIILNEIIKIIEKEKINIVAKN